MTTHLETEHRTEALVRDLRAGMSPKQLSAKYGIGYQTVWKILRPLVGTRLRDIYTPARAATICLLKSLGVSFRRIGKFLGITATRCWQLARADLARDICPTVVVQVFRPTYDVDGNPVVCSEYKMTRRGPTYMSLTNEDGHYKVEVKELIGKIRLPSDG